MTPLIQALICLIVTYNVMDFGFCLFDKLDLLNPFLEIFYKN